MTMLNCETCIRPAHMPAHTLAPYAPSSQGVVGVAGSFVMIFLRTRVILCKCHRYANKQTQTKHELHDWLSSAFDSVCCNNKLLISWFNICSYYYICEVCCGIWGNDTLSEVEMKCKYFTKHILICNNYMKDFYLKNWWLINNSLSYFYNERIVTLIICRLFGAPCTNCLKMMQPYLVKAKT